MGRWGFRIGIAGMAALGVVVGASSPAVAAEVAQEAVVKANPDWTVLWWYAIAGLIAIVLVAFVMAAAFKGGLTVPTDPPSVITPKSPLTGIGASWSFKDSIATNAAGAVVLFTGLFGSKDIVTTLFGDKGANLVAIATVGAALTAGLVALGPVVLVMFQAFRDDDLHTPASVGVAAAFVLAGNGGLVLVLYQTLQAASLATEVRYGMTILASVLLAVFGVLSLIRTFRQGGKPEPASTEGVAALV